MESMQDINHEPRVLFIDQEKFFPDFYLLYTFSDRSLPHTNSLCNQEDFKIKVIEQHFVFHVCAKKISTDYAK